MSRLVLGEALKLRTTRTAIGYAVVGALLALALVLASILGGDPTTPDDKRQAIAVGGTTAVLLILFGVVGATAELRHRTLAPALLAAPARTRLLAARTVAYGVAGLVIGALLVAVALAIGLPLLSGSGGAGLRGSDLARVAGGGVLSTTLCAMLGVGIGALVGNQVAAVIGTVVWLFVLEPLVELVKASALKYTMGEAAGTVAGASTGGLAWGAALAVLAGWTALFLAAAAVADRRRDVD
jgi:ABC-2 type transport system permease protein